jgi:DNA-binding transcriptional regulator YiaG
MFARALPVDWEQSFGTNGATFVGFGWEQGRRRPEGAARVLLALIAKRPRIVQDELRS